MRRWWLLALLVAGVAAATAGGGAAPFAGPDAHRLAQVTADATIGAAAVQAAVLPGRAEESRSTLTHVAPERAPLSLAALLAALVAVPVVARCRSRSHALRSRFDPRRPATGGGPQGPAAPPSRLTSLFVGAARCRAAESEVPN